MHALGSKLRIFAEEISYLIPSVGSNYKSICM